MFLNLGLTSPWSAGNNTSSYQRKESSLENFFNFLALYLSASMCTAFILRLGRNFSLCTGSCTRKINHLKYPVSLLQDRSLIFYNFYSLFEYVPLLEYFFFLVCLSNFQVFFKAQVKRLLGMKLSPSTISRIIFR